MTDGIQPGGSARRSPLVRLRAWLDRAASAAAEPDRRDRGTGLVVFFVVTFSILGVALVVMARDANERIGARSAAQSIAFQAARAGAQQLEPTALRNGSAIIVLSQAKREARSVTEYLCGTYFGKDVVGNTGSKTVSDSDATCVVQRAEIVDGSFAVTVAITTAAGVSVFEASAEPRTG